MSRRQRVGTAYTLTFGPGRAGQGGYRGRLRGPWGCRCHSGKGIRLEVRLQFTERWLVVSLLRQADPDFPIAAEFGISRPATQRHLPRLRVWPPPRIREVWSGGDADGWPDHWMRHKPGLTGSAPGRQPGCRRPQPGPAPLRAPRTPATPRPQADRGDSRIGPRPERLFEARPQHHHGTGAEPGEAQTELCQESSECLGGAHPHLGHIAVVAGDLV